MARRNPPGHGGPDFASARAHHGSMSGLGTGQLTEVPRFGDDEPTTFETAAAHGAPAAPATAPAYVAHSPARSGRGGRSKSRSKSRSRSPRLEQPIWGDESAASDAGMPGAARAAGAAVVKDAASDVDVSSLMQQRSSLMAALENVDRKLSSVQPAVSPLRSAMPRAVPAAADAPTESHAPATAGSVSPAPGTRFPLPAAPAGGASGGAEGDDGASSGSRSGSGSAGDDLYAVKAASPGRRRLGHTHAAGADAPELSQSRTPSTSVYSAAAGPGSASGPGAGTHSVPPSPLSMPQHDGAASGARSGAAAPAGGRSAVAPPPPPSAAAASSRGAHIVFASRPAHRPQVPHTGTVPVPTASTVGLGRSSGSGSAAGPRSPSQRIFTASATGTPALAASAPHSTVRAPVLTGSSPTTPFSYSRDYGHEVSAHKLRSRVSDHNPVFSHVREAEARPAAGFALPHRGASGGSGAPGAVAASARDSGTAAGPGFVGPAMRAPLTHGENHTPYYSHASLLVARGSAGGASSSATTSLSAALAAASAARDARASATPSTAGTPQHIKRRDNSTSPSRVPALTASGGSGSGGGGASGAGAAGGAPATTLGTPVLTRSDGDSRDAETTVPMFSSQPASRLATPTKAAPMREPRRSAGKAAAAPAGAGRPLRVGLT